MPKPGRPLQALHLVRNRGLLEAVVKATPGAVPPVSFLAEAFMRLDMKFAHKLSRTTSKAGQRGIACEIVGAGSAGSCKRCRKLQGVAEAAGSC
eukprot:10185429-Alexandrium_andersonii.AAC.1